MEYSERVTLDAHTLIWYVHEDSNIRLSRVALDVIDNAERNGTIYVPTVALLEILRLIEKKRYPLSFDTLVERIRHSRSYQPVPLDMDIIEVTKRFPALELHDRVIVATAIVTNSVLVSRDKEIRAAGVRVVWSKAELGNTT